MDYTWGQGPDLALNLKELRHPGSAGVSPAMGAGFGMYLKGLRQSRHRGLSLRVLGTRAPPERASTLMEKPRDGS